MGKGSNNTSKDTRGRKPAKDPKVLISFWVHQSKVDILGGKLPFKNKVETLIDQSVEEEKAKQANSEKEGKKTSIIIIP